MTRSIPAALAALATLAATGAATASSVDMSFTGGFMGRYFNISYGDTTRTVGAGRLEYEVSRGDGERFGDGQSLYTFCTEITQEASRDTLEYGLFGGEGSDSDGSIANLPDSGSGMGLADAGLVSELFSAYYTDAVDGTGSRSDRTKAAAFQLAIWEIVFDEGLDVDAGSGFKVNAGSGSTVALAQSMLDSLTGTSDINPNIIGFGNLSAQDQLTMIPLPAAMAMGLVGLVGVVVARRRRALA